jgi:tetratricopeptide (TPR) repeat protein
VFGADSTLVAELTMIAVPAELERGELDAAISLARRSLDIYLTEARPDTTVHAYRARILGQALAVARVGDEAVETLEEAARVSANAGAPHAGRSFLGLALAHAGRLAEADAQLRLALEGAPPGSRAEMQATRHRGTLLRLERRSAEALPWIERSLAASAGDRFQRGEHAASLVELGLTQLELGEVAAARQSFGRAAEILDELQPQRMTPARADLMIGMARVHLHAAEPADALSPAQAADAYWRERRPDSRWAGEAALWVGRTHAALGQAGEARAALSRAASLLAASNLPADVALLKLVQ